MGMAKYWMKKQRDSESISKVSNQFGERFENIDQKQIGCQISIIKPMEEMFFGHQNDFEDNQVKIGSSCSIEGICDQPQSTKQFPYEFDNEQTNSHSILNQLTSLKPYNTERGIDTNRKVRPVTDRFIPQRKRSRPNPFMELQQKIEKRNNENEDSQADQQSGKLHIAQIYKKHILRVTPGNPNIETAGSFKNINKLKFSQKKIQCPDITVSSQAIIDIKESIESEAPLASRKINKVPIKVLDAPSLQDDFYLNLTDWSESNILAVGLTSNVYLWSATTSKVSKLCDLGYNDIVTGISWSRQSNILAIGTNTGEVQLWDVNRNSIIRTMIGHLGRIGAISWNSGNYFSTGSRDKNILHRDMRSQAQYVEKLVGHKQEVCGLKWSFDNQQIASGGNDNKLMVWNSKSVNPLYTMHEHNAAVKALAWSPHQHGLLVSGGGTADRTIRFWNTHSGQCINMIDAGSQVCNLMFSKTVNEFVSTHGYSLNEINIWKYPKLQKVATLTGHTYRVLYLAMNPEGNTIVTGAGDETLRFWNVFPSAEPKTGKYWKSMLSDDASTLR